jgi:molybdopterin-containing oxidoreductase family iron-sulfur binding subunit
VSIGDDLLGPGPHQVSHAAAWMTRRGEMAPGAGRMRMHVAESVLSLTGSVASTRLPCDASRLPLLAQAAAARLSLAGFTMPELTEAERKWIGRAIDELSAHQGRSLFAIGPVADPTWRALAPAINQTLGNAGITVWYSEPITPAIGDTQTLNALASDMASGVVDTLVTIDCNPAYAAHGALDFGALMERIPNHIHAGQYFDETAKLCRWHLPLSHPLETFGDARAIDGSAVILQPVVAPLYSSRSVHQIADMLLGTVDPTSDAAPRTTWQKTFGANFEQRWTRALHDGLVEGTATQPITITPRPVTLPAAAMTAQGDLDVVFLPDPAVWDGRFGNIAWLQELPKPLTKITWDNVIGVSPAIAAAKNLSNGDVVDVTVGTGVARGPAWIVPGQAPNTVALFFGYGRRTGGDIAVGRGYDAFAVQPAEQTFAARCSVERIGRQHPIATTQAHHRMDGFDFVREVTAKAPQTAPPKESHTFYPDWNVKDPSIDNVPDHAWGMVIDLDTCIGCNACVSACNVENNVLVVGKDQVARGREMLWLRVDRYYTGDVENPKSFFQPVPCMHCEKAPCEMGCPVHATAHSPEGVNQMVYNRCIGTRTCSSYCPYKVRRFNWFDYRHIGEADQAAKNPDVTVRSRGVMEKCSYCTQRIQAAHVQADKENRPLRRDEVVTACQQACPTKAIVFGDLKDNESAVAQRRRSGRHYVLLEELGTRPRTTYLARWNDEPGEGGGA